MKFLLCADLHLKNEEKDYSFQVLKEIAGLCKKENCGALLFAGDVFDSWGDTETLRAGFSAELEALPTSCAVYFLPGNHEELRAGSAGQIENLSFGRAALLSKKPWSLHKLDDKTELLAVPFQSDYSAYRDWKVPPKEKAIRILLAHGTVAGMIYTGPSEEETDGVLDDNIFAHLQVDLAALGHIHTGLSETRGNTLIAYPGSSRVWRAGETGKRCVLLGDTETVPLVLKPRALASAGEYRIIPVYAAPGGELKYRLPAELAPADWLHLEAEGVVDDEPPVIASLEKLKADLGKKCRVVSSDTGKLSVLAGISTHPLAVRFLRAWEKEAPRYAKEDAGVYGLARLQGLLKIKEIAG